MRLTFSRSQACAESHGLQEDDLVVEIPSPEGHWVQLTYGWIRDHNGDFPVAHHDGCWWYKDQPWSDVVIDFTQLKEQR